MSTIQVKMQLPFEELLKVVEQLSLAELEKLWSQIVALQARHKAVSLPKDETDLLLKINQGLPLDVQRRYGELIEKRQARTLTTEEYQELLNLTDQVEKADAKRVEYLASLARLRGVSLPILLKDLGIEHPPSKIR